MNLGEKLRSLRQKEHRTLKEQSELCGVKLNTVFRWEHDIATPGSVALKKIAELHNVQLEWLTQDRAPMENPESTNIDQQIISMIGKLSEKQKYQILGYIERVYIEAYEQQQ